jgi:hypothetical protein
MSEVIDSAIPDGVQLRRRDGERSWPVHAYIRCDDVSATVQRVREELNQLVEEAADTGRGVTVRAVILRAGVAHASRTIHVPAPARVDPELEEEAQPDAHRALVATNRDLRQLLEVFARQQGEAVSRAMQGWTQAQVALAAAQAEVAELRAALSIAEQAEERDPVLQQAIASVMPAVPGLLASMAASKASQGD